MNPPTKNIVNQLRDAITILEGVSDDLERGNRDEGDMLSDLEVVGESLAHIKAFIEENS